jgi:ribokinase
VVVVGSAHVDLVATAARLPGRGESVSGGTFAMSPGGKAGGQACQLARLGIEAHLITRLGQDQFGDFLWAELQRRGVQLGHVPLDTGNATGASVVLAGDGDYTSIIAPGAAGRLGRADIDAAATLIEGADALLLQLEIDAEISAVAADIARRGGGRVVLNASPAPRGWGQLPAALRASPAMLVVNAVEAGLLLQAGAMASPEATLRALRDLTGIGEIVLTLGKAGSAALVEERVFAQAAIPAEVVNAVGAGDAFLGAYVASRLDGGDVQTSLLRGAAAGSIAVSRPGTYESMGTAEEIAALLHGLSPRPAESRPS